MKSLFCPEQHCSRNPRVNPAATEFASAGALGSHRRRAHGIVSLLMAARATARRPAGGTRECPYRCGVAPYVTRGGLATHLRLCHGYETADPQSIARRQRRARAHQAHATGRPEAHVLELAELPPSPVIASYVPDHRRDALNPSEVDYLRLRLLFVFNGTWAREFDADPTVLRDTAVVILAANFDQARIQSALRRKNGTPRAIAHMAG